MNLTEIASMDATAQANLVATGKATAAEIIDAAIERIERLNPRIQATSAGGWPISARSRFPGTSLAIPPSRCRCI